MTYYYDGSAIFDTNVLLAQDFARVLGIYGDGLGIGLAEEVISFGELLTQLAGLEILSPTCDH